MALPYKISTLLYCFNEPGEILLLKRTRQPNRGCWSPCGGKLDTVSGESPYACACREAYEELNLELIPADLHLTGLVSETGYEGEAHWLMFLFEVKPKLTQLPAEHGEGVFRFFARDELRHLELPPTDRDQLWPLFWAHRGGFFAAHCVCENDGKYQWTVAESRPAPSGP